MCAFASVQPHHKAGRTWPDFDDRTVLIDDDLLGSDQIGTLYVLQLDVEALGDGFPT
jgi:hypothetical protein